MAVYTCFACAAPITRKHYARAPAVLKKPIQHFIWNVADETLNDANVSAWKPGRVKAPRPIRKGGIGGSRAMVRVQGSRIGQGSSSVSPGVKVMSGAIRGRRLASPNVHIRPMMSKVREAVFCMLETLNGIQSNGVVLDLFAGSGSVGIEALSRGIGGAVFVDNASECIDTITKNLNDCGYSDKAQVFCGRAEDFLKLGEHYNNGQHYSLITVTPPYEEVDYSELLAAIGSSKCVGERSLVVIEYPVELKCLPPSVCQRLVGLRNRRYGRTVVAIYGCQPSIDIEPKLEEFFEY